MPENFKVSEKLRAINVNGVLPKTFMAQTTLRAQLVDPLKFQTLSYLMIIMIESY